MKNLGNSPAIPSIFDYAIRIKQLHASSALNSRIQDDAKIALKVGLQWI